MNSTQQHTEKKRIFLVSAVLCILIALLLIVRWQRDASRTTFRGQEEQISVVEKVPDTRVPTEAVNEQNTLFVRPSISSLAIGESTKVSVYFSAPGKVLDGADVKMRFDPAFLEIQNLSVDSGFFQQAPRIYVDNETGRMEVTGFMPINTQTLEQPILFYTFDILAKKSGTASLDFIFEKGSTVLSTLVESKTSRNVLDLTNGATVSILP